ncbi:MAG: B12-binding domain-containing radical SAM protein [Ignavibacteria bacterium]|nr:MAG: B12-binding domain-containing radical SAM protein [Ignavibacteria bacterium]
MKILLTHGYFLHEDSAEQKIMKPYPPLGILYISAYLEQQGVANKIFDTTFSSKKELNKYLLQYLPDYLGIYVNLMTKLNVLEIINFIKSHDELSRTKIILGGPDVRYNADKFINHGADYLVIGEGEESFYELIKALDTNTQKSLKEIPGIGFKDDAGNTTLTQDRTLIKKIDELPIPNREKIDIAAYQNVWKKYHGSDAVSVSTMRGCPYTCRWCSRAVYGLSYRRRSPAIVIDELEIIQINYHPDTLWFVDDVFTISHKWMSEFTYELKRRNLKINYECITRADRLNEEVISMLKNSGCFRVWIGAESGSQRIIDAMDRREDVKQVREMIKLTKKYGIETGTFIMLGYPGETENDIEETIEHLKISNPDYFTITIAYPINGTEFYQEIESKQIKSFNWEINTDRDRDFERNYSRNYYNFAVRRVVNEVNYHKQKQSSGKLSTKAISFKSRSLMAKAGMMITR